MVGPAHEEAGATSATAVLSRDGTEDAPPRLLSPPRRLSPIDEAPPSSPNDDDVASRSEGWAQSQPTAALPAPPGAAGVAGGLTATEAEGSTGGAAGGVIVQHFRRLSAPRRSRQAEAAQVDGDLPEPAPADAARCEADARLAAPPVFEPLAMLLMLLGEEGDTCDAPAAAALSAPPDAPLGSMPASLMPPRGGAPLAAWGPPELEVRRTLSSRAASRAASSPAVRRSPSPARPGSSRAGLWALAAAPATDAPPEDEDGKETAWARPRSSPAPASAAATAAPAAKADRRTPALRNAASPAPRVPPPMGSPLPRSSPVPGIGGPKRRPLAVPARPGTVSPPPSPIMRVRSPPPRPAHSPLPLPLRVPSPPRPPPSPHAPSRRPARSPPPSMRTFVPSPPSPERRAGAAMLLPVATRPTGAAAVRSPGAAAATPGSAMHRAAAAPRPAFFFPPTLLPPPRAWSPPPMWRDTGAILLYSGCPGAALAEEPRRRHLSSAAAARATQCVLPIAAPFGARADGGSDGMRSAPPLDEDPVQQPPSPTAMPHRQAAWHAVPIAVPSQLPPGAGMPHSSPSGPWAVAPRPGVVGRHAVAAAPLSLPEPFAPPVGAAMSPFPASPDALSRAAESAAVALLSRATAFNSPPATRGASSAAAGSDGGVRGAFRRSRSPPRLRDTPASRLQESELARLRGGLPLSAAAGRAPAAAVSPTGRRVPGGESPTARVAAPLQEVRWFSDAPSAAGWVPAPTGPALPCDAALAMPPSSLALVTPPLRWAADATQAAAAPGGAAEGAADDDADGQGWVSNSGVALAPPLVSRRRIHRAHSTAGIAAGTPERPMPGSAIGTLVLSPSQSAGGVAAASVWAAAVASNAAEDAAAVSRPGGHEEAGDHLPTVVVVEQPPKAASVSAGDGLSPGPVSRPETHGDSGDLPALILARGGGSGGITARPSTRSSRDVLPAATAWDATPVVVPVLSGSLRRVPSMLATQVREDSARSARVGSWVESGSARQRPRFAGSEGAVSTAGYMGPPTSPHRSGWTQAQVQRQHEASGLSVPLLGGAAELQRPSASSELLPPACVVAGDSSDSAMLPRLPPGLLEPYQGGAGQQRGLVRSESGADLPRTRTQASAGAVVQALSRRRPVSAARWGVVRAPGIRQPAEEAAAAFASMEDLLLESDNDGQ